MSIYTSILMSIYTVINMSMHTSVHTRWAAKVGSTSSYSFGHFRASLHGCTTSLRYIPTVRACVCACVHACMRACVRACICVRVYVHACAHMFSTAALHCLLVIMPRSITAMHTHAYIHAQMRPCVHVRICAHARTKTHTHTHMHTCVDCGHWRSQVLFAATY